MTAEAHWQVRDAGGTAAPADAALSWTAQPGITARLYTYACAPRWPLGRPSARWGVSLAASAALISMQFISSTSSSSSSSSASATSPARYCSATPQDTVFITGQCVGYNWSANHTIYEAQWRRWAWNNARRHVGGILSVNKLRVKTWKSGKFLCDGVTQTVYFGWCIIQHTRVCKQSAMRH